MHSHIYTLQLECRGPPSPIIIEGSNPNSPSASPTTISEIIIDSSKDVGCSSPHIPCPSSIEELTALFEGRLNEKQVEAIYRATGGDFDPSMECILEGPTINSILEVLNDAFGIRSVIKIEVDPEELWQDMVAQYKSLKMDVTKRLRIRFEQQPAVDTGGVRRMVYSAVYTDFVNNKLVRLFDGPSHCCRPCCTAESRSSGLFKILGSMVAHSICQDGIGFPYLSPTCYWYLIGGDERAMEFVSVEDVGADVVSVISKVLL